MSSYSSPCLVWTPMKDEVGGNVEYPSKIARAIDAPVYTFSRPDSLEGRFHEFREHSFFESVMLSSPLHELYVNTQYSTWKAPAEHDVIITRGPKAIHTIQRLDQDHIHLFDGGYRGLFLHKDEYENFHSKSGPARFGLGLFRHGMRSMVQSSLNMADTVVACSEWAERTVESLFNRKVDEIIYPPVPVSKYSPKSSTTSYGEFYLYMANIGTLYRTEEMIHAFNELPYKLLIAGDGSERDRFERMANENIEFLGYVTGRQKKALLASAKALVNPTNHSFGRVVIESLASGRPVISLDRGYPPYIIDHGENGILYPEGVENLIAAIETFEESGVDSSPDEFRSLAEQYSYSSVEERWRDLIY